MEDGESSRLNLTKDRRNVEGNLRWDILYSFIYRNPFNGSQRKLIKKYIGLTASELRQILKKHEDKENTATTFGFQRGFSPESITQHQYRFNSKLENSFKVPYPLAYLKLFMKEPVTDHHKTTFRNFVPTPRQGTQFLHHAYRRQKTEEILSEI